MPERESQPKRDMRDEILAHLIDREVTPTFASVGSRSGHIQDSIRPEIFAEKQSVGQAARVAGLATAPLRESSRARVRLALPLGAELARTRCAPRPTGGERRLGGTLGTLIQMTIDPGALPRPMLQQVIATDTVMAMGGDMPMAMSTPVEARESLVVAVARLRLQFVWQSR